MNIEKLRERDDDKYDMMICRVCLFAFLCESGGFIGYLLYLFKQTKRHGEKIDIT